uniref:Uncharacterized protein n=1 Tax=Molossus molossus TaxID=27622 RepID=A0A7J8I0Q0_MOLMO|nr:hypothetical protein HJG59_010752 [Molossus molossus]
MSWLLGRRTDSSLGSSRREGEVSRFQSGSSKPSGGGAGVRCQDRDTVVSISSCGPGWGTSSQANEVKQGQGFTEEGGTRPGAGAEQMGLGRSARRFWWLRLVTVPPLGVLVSSLHHSHLQRGSPRNSLASPGWVRASAED